MVEGFMDSRFIIGIDEAATLVGELHELHWQAAAVGNSPEMQFRRPASSCECANGARQDSVRAAAGQTRYEGVPELVPVDEKRRSNGQHPKRQEPESA
jgi:hypothetical protein